jgi:GNAT superfamily N-acetyltransferase
VTTEIALLRTAADDLTAEIAALVNRVYADAEKGLWAGTADRTNAAQIAEYVQAGQLAVARLVGALAGVVRVRQLDDDLGEFGMLVAAPEHRGVGLGRDLVAFAEGWARDRGLSRMQLELLMPQTWSHPVKDFLRDWYVRLGYRQVRLGDLADDYPALVPLLATPCDFVVFHKEISGSSTRSPG